MKKLEIIIRPSKFEEVKQQLTTIGIHGMNYCDVQGFGRQRHGGAGDGELAVAVAQTVGGQLGPDGFGAHGWMLLG